MLALALALIESEQRDRSRRAVDKRPADNGSFLVVRKVDQSIDFGDGHFTLTLTLLRTHRWPPLPLRSCSTDMFSISSCVLSVP